MADSTNLNVTCDNCNQPFVMLKAMQKRTPFEDKEICEFGLLCPHCEYWQHAYFMTPELTEHQQSVSVAQRKVAESGGNQTLFKRWKRAQRNYQHHFDKVQFKTQERLNNVLQH